MVYIVCCDCICSYHRQELRDDVIQYVPTSDFVPRGTYPSEGVIRHSLVNVREFRLCVWTSLCIVSHSSGTNSDHWFPGKLNLIYDLFTSLPSVEYCDCHGDELEMRSRLPLLTTRWLSDFPMRYIDQWQASMHTVREEWRRYIRALSLGQSGWSLMETALVG